jgi:hypothetical protein
LSGDISKNLREDKEGIEGQHKAIKGFVMEIDIKGLDFLKIVCIIPV